MEKQVLWVIGVELLLCGQETEKLIFVPICLIPHDVSTLCDLNESSKDDLKFARKQLYFIF